MFPGHLKIIFLAGLKVNYLVKNTSLEDLPLGGVRKLQNNSGIGLKAFRWSEIRGLTDQQHTARFPGHQGNLQPSSSMCLFLRIHLVQGYAPITKNLDRVPIPKAR